MGAVPSVEGASRAGGRGEPFDRVAVALVLGALVAMYAPTLYDWQFGARASESQGHELLILLVSAWLGFSMRNRLAALPSMPALAGGAALLAVGLCVYVVGRAFDALRLELASLMVLVIALLLRWRGWPAVRLAWFPIFFLLFAFPLPYVWVLTITGPLKEAVSAAATQILFWLGYPIGRSGVVITIAQYQLLVVEACAGLQTMFVLEAMGLLYANLVKHTLVLRNVLLAVLVVPVSFAANVVRVIVLALVTYYFGDDAGQGFLHDFAGVVLFIVGLVLIVGVDIVLGRLLRTKGALA